MTNGRVEIRKFFKKLLRKKNRAKKSDERFLFFLILFFPSLNFEWHYQEKLYISLLNRSGGSPGV
jgi:IS4 transposase